jgi:hypothetical protein
MSVFPEFDYPPLASYMMTGSKIEPVHITLLQDLPTELSFLISLIDKIELLPRRCYRNARLIADLSDLQTPLPIHYVEGECIFPRKILGKIPIIFHAWNYLPTFDLHIDATWEKLKPVNLDCTYYPTIQDSWPELKIKYPSTQEDSAFWLEWLSNLMPQLDESSPYWWQLLEQELGSSNCLLNPSSSCLEDGAGRITK